MARVKNPNRALSGVTWREKLQKKLGERDWKRQGGTLQAATIKQAYGEQSNLRYIKLNVIRIELGCQITSI